MDVSRLADSLDTLDSLPYLIGIGRRPRANEVSRVAAGLGIGPRSRGPEPRVRPLHHPAKQCLLYQTFHTFYIVFGYLAPPTRRGSAANP